jgi:hypothetical protein
MANFRFNNEQGQDDTGRVATYIQRLYNLNSSNIVINPNGYVNTYLLSGTQTQTSVTVNIAPNNKPNIGDYLELIIAPNTDGLTLDFGTGFLNASQIVVAAGERQIANFQYDGTDWVNVLATSGGGGGGAVNTVNNIAPVSGNVDLGTIVNSVNGQSGAITIAAPPQVYIGLLGAGAPNGNVQVLKNTISGCTMTVSKIGVGRYRLTSNIRLYFDSVASNISVSYPSVISSSQAIPNLNYVIMGPSGENYSFDFNVYNNLTSAFNDDWTTIRFKIEVY